MFKRFGNTQIGIMQRYIFANQGNIDFIFEILNLIYH